MKAVLASLVTASVLCAGAFAANITPGQFAKLSSRVSALEKANAQLTGYLNQCLHTFKPVSQYGDSSAADSGDTTINGYVFRLANGTDIKTTALDWFAPSGGGSPELFVAGADHDCSSVTP